MSDVLLDIMRNFANSAPVPVALAKEGTSLADWVVSAPEALEDRANAFRAFIDDVGSICDYAAYYAMLAAVGIQRYQRLCSSRSGFAEQGDRVQLFKAGDSSLLDHLNRWAQVESDGILQFKMTSTHGPHTFAVERTFDGGTRSFRVYQAYLKAYRLKDFLGNSPDDAYVRHSAMKKAISDFNQASSNLGRPSFEQLEGASDGSLPATDESLQAALPNQKLSAPFLRKYRGIKQIGQDAVQALATARLNVGGGQSLNFNDLFSRCFQPMQRGLLGGVPMVEYQDLVGHPVKGSVDFDCVLVLSCENVDRTKISSHAKAFYGSEHTAGYVDLEDFIHS